MKCDKCALSKACPLVWKPLGRAKCHTKPQGWAQHSRAWRQWICSRSLVRWLRQRSPGSTTCAIGCRDWRTSPMWVGECSHKMGARPALCPSLAPMCSSTASAPPRRKVSLWHWGGIPTSRSLPRSFLARNTKMKKHEPAQSSRPAAATAKAVERGGPDAFASLRLPSQNVQALDAVSSTDAHRRGAGALPRRHGDAEREHTHRGLLLGLRNWERVVHPFHIFVQHQAGRGLRWARPALACRPCFMRDMCLERFRLGVLAVFGQRFDAGVWHKMVLTVMLLISRRETAERYNRLIKTAKKVGWDMRGAAAQVPTRASHKRFVGGAGAPPSRFIDMWNLHGGPSARPPLLPNF